MVAILLATVLAQAFPTISSASPNPEKIQIPANVTEGLGYLLGLVEKHGLRHIDMEKAGPVIDFVLSEDKTRPALYYSKDDFGPDSAYHEFEVDQGLGNIVAYAYSPSIPSEAVIPSSIRVSFWKKTNGFDHVDSWSWDYPPKEGAVQAVTGIEYEETTPDVFSGTYYGYDLDRSLILCRYGERNVFFSISRQREKAPGKKAFTLGDDQDWAYLYTDETGMNKAGMGWVTPYMYESFAVTVFIDRGEGVSPPVKGAMFKWLDAGAGGMNMVATRHIDAGIRRFENAFRTVMEDPSLPPPEVVSDAFSKIESMPDEGIKRQVELYFDLLKKRYGHEEVFQDEDFAAKFAGSEYVAQLTRQQMEGILGVEYMKNVLGKNPILGVSRFLSQKSCQSGVSPAGISNPN